MTAGGLPPVGLFAYPSVDDPVALRGYAAAMWDHYSKTGKGGSKIRFTRDDLRRGTIWLVACHHTFGLVPCENTLALVTAFVGEGISKGAAEEQAIRVKYPLAADPGVPVRLLAAYQRAIHLEAELVQEETKSDLFSASAYSIAKKLLEEGLIMPKDRTALESEKTDSRKGTIGQWREREYYAAMVQMLRENIFRNWTR